MESCVNQYPPDLENTADRVRSTEYTHQAASCLWSTEYLERKGK